MTSTAELQAIRKRLMLRPTSTNSYATYGESNADCKALLALYDAQSDEVRRLRSDIQTAVDLLLAFNKDAHARNPMAVTAIDEFLAYRGLGSQP